MLAITFGLIYVLMCPVLNPWLVNGLAFHPKIGSEFDASKVQEIAGITGQEFSFHSGLDGWLYRDGDNVILFNHGTQATCAIARKKWRRC
jgi:hypothetical protein